MCSDRSTVVRNTILPAALCLFLLLPLGCGKKGDPLPPLRYVPQTSDELTVSQRGYEIRLGLPYPTIATSGLALPGVASVEVWRASRPVPERLRLDGADADADLGPEEAEVAARAKARERRQEINRPLSDAELEAGSELIANFADERLTAAAVGDDLILRVPLPRPLPDPPRIHYFTVRTVAATGDVSARSPQAVIAPRTPPEPPRDFEVEAKVDGVEISWSVAEDPAVVGYNLYRRDARSRVFTTPVARPPKGSDRFFDRTVTVGETYIYTVTSVVSRQPLIESALVEVREVDYRDRFPPPTPANLVALAEDGRVRVVWEGVDADDLAGYLVLRRRGGAQEGEDFTLMTDAPRAATEYVDTDVEAGAVYTYRVIARDEVGNDSEAAEATTEAR